MYGVRVLLQSSNSNQPYAPSDAFLLPCPIDFIVINAAADELVHALVLPKFSAVETKNVLLNCDTRIE